MIYKIDDQTLRELLVNPRVAPKNHYAADCPFCLKTEHFYINRGTYLGDCKKCGETTNLFKLLQKLGKLDLIHFGKKLQADVLENRISIVNQLTEIQETPTRNKPIGFKRLTSHPYLDSRGFTQHDYELDEIGTTTIVTKLRGYLVILIKENNIVKGYVARSTKTKEEAKELKQQGIFHLRYKNSEDDFSCLLGGYDELTAETHTVILVEGYFDKKNVDRLLKLHDIGEIKCLCCFGKKVSEQQALKLINKGIENVVVLFDPDAINDSKKHSLKLTDYFNVEVGFLNEKDPGDLTESEIVEVMNNLHNPFDFYVNRVQKRNYAK